MKRFAFSISVCCLAPAWASGIACGGGETGLPGGSGAQLTIVGDAQLTVEVGETATLAVRYHDNDGEPLVGEVSFAIRGVSLGASLSDQVVAAGPDGVSRVNLSAGDGGIEFEVVATAPDADPVSWTIVVSELEVEPAGRLDGVYYLETEIDLFSPSPPGFALTVFADLTDDPFDPATWVLDELLAAVDFGPVEGVIIALRPALDSVLYELLHDLAPDLLDDLVALGDAYIQVVSNLGLHSYLAIEPGVSEDSLVAVHEITGFSCSLGGISAQHDFSEIGASPVLVPAIGVGFERASGRMSVDEHDIPLPFGRMLAVCIDEVIAPTVEAQAGGLGDLLLTWIACSTVGQAIAGEIDGASPNLFTGACELGIEAAANLLLAELVAMDGKHPSVVTVSGTARAEDSTGGPDIDRLASGRWKGALRVGDHIEALVSAASTFTGVRID